MGQAAQSLVRQCLLVPLGSKLRRLYASRIQGVFDWTISFRCFAATRVSGRTAREIEVAPCVALVLDRPHPLSKRVGPSCLTTGAHGGLRRQALETVSSELRLH